MSVLASSPRSVQAYLLAEACADGEAIIHYSAVLRALDELFVEGSISRIEVQRAYLPTERHGKLTLACSLCGAVAALDHDATGGLAAHALSPSFKPSRYIVEVLGVCALCQQ